MGKPSDLKASVRVLQEPQLSLAPDESRHALVERYPVEGNVCFRRDEVGTKERSLDYIVS